MHFIISFDMFCMYAKYIGHYVGDKYIISENGSYK